MLNAWASLYGNNKLFACVEWVLCGWLCLALSVFESWCVWQRGFSDELCRPYGTTVLLFSYHHHASPSANQSFSPKVRVDVNRYVWWVVSMLDCQSRNSGLFKSRPGQKFGSRFLRPLANSARMSTLTIRCQWKVETVRDRIGHLPTYDKAKKMKLLALHVHGCLRASVRDCSSSP